MEQYLSGMKGYWDGRFGGEGRIWGSEPSTTAVTALSLFRKRKAVRVLVPGAGYGRNTKLFSDAGLEVTGVEISGEAVALGREYDSRTFFHCASFLDLPVADESFCAIYCFNVLHLFRRPERELFVQKCFKTLKVGGLAVFAVFSDTENSYGKGREVEPGTFESKPGRPVHYFTEYDLKELFAIFTVLECGLAEDREDHGAEGPHTHKVRTIIVEKPRQP